MDSSLAKLRKTVDRIPPLATFFANVKDDPERYLWDRTIEFYGEEKGSDLDVTPVERFKEIADAKYSRADLMRAIDETKAGIYYIGRRKWPSRIVWNGKLVDIANAVTEGDEVHESNTPSQLSHDRLTVPKAEAVLFPRLHPMRDEVLIDDAEGADVEGERTRTVIVPLPRNRQVQLTLPEPFNATDAEIVAAWIRDEAAAE